MDRLSYRLLGLVSLVVMLALIGCAKRVELRLEVETTYIGPQIAESINVRLTDSYSLSDYKVNLSCTYTNIGDPGRVNVLATVAQGDKSWERRESLYAVAGQPVTSKFVFEEPTFDLGRILAPLALLVVPSPYGGVASAFLGGEGESGIRGSCQAYPNAADMKARLDCILTNVGEGSGTVTVRGSRNGTGQTSEVSMGPKEKKTVPFLFQVKSEEDRFECQVE